VKKFEDLFFLTLTFLPLIICFVYATETQSYIKLIYAKNNFYIYILTVKFHFKVVFTSELKNIYLKYLCLG